MRFSSPISCITPLDARQESLPTSRRGEEDPWARVVHSNERRPANPARKQKTSLERLPNWAVRSGPRARNEREAAARSRRPCEASGQRDAYR